MCMYSKRLTCVKQSRKKKGEISLQLLDLRKVHQYERDNEPLGPF